MTVNQLATRINKESQSREVNTPATVTNQPILPHSGKYNQQVSETWSHRASEREHIESLLNTTHNCTESESFLERIIKAYHYEALRLNIPPNLQEFHHGPENFHNGKYNQQVSETWSHRISEREFIESPLHTIHNCIKRESFLKGIIKVYHYEALRLNIPPDFQKFHHDSETFRR